MANTNKIRKLENDRKILIEVCEEVLREMEKRWEDGSLEPLTIAVQHALKMVRTRS